MAGEKRREDLFPSARYVASYAYLEQMPESGGVECAVVGRSNVGKSSFVNHVFGNRRLARVSRRPGTTRLANVFACSDGVLWVDLPGYGYAHAGGAEKRLWVQLIASYVERRCNLAGILWLVDARHPAMAYDVQAYRWLLQLKHPLLMVMTKCDKLNRGEVVEHARRYAALFPEAAGPVLYSIRDPLARNRFWSAYKRWRNEHGG